MRIFTDAIDRFCRKHPRFGIPNLMLYIVIGSAIVYVLDMVSNYTCSGILDFDRSLILSGQVWRIITFVFVPESRSIVALAISLYFYWFIGSAMEREFGTGKFTCFWLVGTLLSIIFGMIAGYSSNYYVCMSMFFAFATLYPDLQFLLFFIIPIKAKWLAWVDAAFFLYEIITSTFPYNLLPLVAFVNYLLFFGEDLFAELSRALGCPGRARAPKEKKVITIDKAAKQIRENKGYLHKCSVCGRTDTDYPALEFRYCSKCKGYYCYCMDHINNHVHITD